jgi:[ribosomal protein S5]-alanine N-acetyltransferase
MPTYQSFETERLIIRPTSEEDAEFIFALLNTPKWHKFIGDRNVTTVEKAREYIENKMLPQLERLGYSSYTLVRKADNVKIGNCGLYDREGLDGVDIGFAFLPEYEKQGYAYEAASRLKEAAIHEFGLNEISAITTKDNSASQRLLEKLGLSLTGTTKLPNSKEELLLYKTSKPI